ncbi:MAG: UDP-N-acetylmuramoyl-tripeptide--D-alanyl-D-alanine ligase [Bdellovibrionota bacterium]
MMTFSDTFIREAIGGGTDFPQFNAARIHTDTRSIQPGDLFVAIKGDRFDGHDFVKQALEKGACAALVHSPFKSSFDSSFQSKLIETSDNLQALRQIASAHRKRLKAKIFVVGGSNGKTTTKEYLSFLLQAHFSKHGIFKTKKSENSILGVALSLLAIRDEEFAVLEVGIDEPGWMEKHLELIRPDAGLLTCIQEEHLERLKNIETVAREELQLVHYLKKNSGRFAANVDSSWIREANLPPQSIRYGLKERADIEGLFKKPNILSCFGINWLNPLPGEHNALNLLAALTGLVMMSPTITKEEIEKISRRLNEFEGEAHRSRWLSFKNDVFVFDDCYNANPSSMESAMTSFQQLAEGIRQVLILGDMLDLGPESISFHQRILNIAETSGANEILTLGSNFAKAYRHVPSERTKCFLEIDDLKNHIEKNIAPQTAYLLKGSRGMGLERLLSIWNNLKA